MNKKPLNTKTIAATAVMLALSLIIGTVESLIPPIVPVLPYFRLGLSNLVILFTMLSCGAVPSLAVTVGKALLVPLFVGNPVMIIYSASASLIAYIVSFFLVKLKKLRLPAISIVSSISHNFIQISVAALMTQSTVVFAYMPLLGLLGAAAGAIIGCLTWLLVKYLPEKLVF